jgi:hypothetical protein
LFARLGGDNFACCCAASAEDALVAGIQDMQLRIQKYPIHLHLTFQVVD